MPELPNTLTYIRQVSYSTSVWTPARKAVLSPPRQEPQPGVHRTPGGSTPGRCHFHHWAHPVLTAGAGTLKGEDFTLNFTFALSGAWVNYTHKANCWFVPHCSCCYLWMFQVLATCNWALLTTPTQMFQYKDVSSHNLFVKDTRAVKNAFIWIVLVMKTHFKPSHNCPCFRAAGQPH